MTASSEVLQESPWRLPRVLSWLAAGLLGFIYVVASCWTTSVCSSITEINPVHKGFLVWSPRCRIPDIDPFSKDAWKLFHPQKYHSCDTKQPLTFVTWSEDQTNATLNVDEHLVSSYLGKGQVLECCYELIRRDSKTPDAAIKKSKCVTFRTQVQLERAAEFITVTCKSKHLKWKKYKEVYHNAHALINEKDEVRQRMNDHKALAENSTTRPISVLLIGIDSISRLNIIRTMPKTVDFLRYTGWSEMKGYNKMDDNTYPNLMAILTGYNSSDAYALCKPTTTLGLNECPFIWKDFKKHGYVTAYGEDAADINTFNYHKVGFHEIPTDYYMRPFYMAAEKYLKVITKSTLKYCLGPVSAAEHLFKYILDFTSKFKNDPYFGLFWTNTFSHNDISTPSSMDNKVLELLQELEVRGTLNTTIVFFFSDHGMRFGKIRELLTGWYEERLPFMFASFPEWFQKQYPQAVESYKINTGRFTTPFDFHMTLKDILHKSISVQDFNVSDLYLKPPRACAACQSLFRPVPWDRSCEETGIVPHWCTCTPYEVEDVRDDPNIMVAARFALKTIRNELNNHTQCATMSLNKIMNTRRHILTEVVDTKDYLIVFVTLPGSAIFEATIRIQKGNLSLQGSISRLNEYATQSHCIHVDRLRKYCYC